MRVKLKELTKQKKELEKQMKKIDKDWGCKVVWDEELEEFIVNVPGPGQLDDDTFNTWFKNHCPAEKVDAPGRPYACWNCKFNDERHSYKNRCTILNRRRDAKK